MKTQRNDPCPCKSGKKYKKCCSSTDELNNTITERLSLKIKDFTFAIEPDIEDACRCAINQMLQGKHAAATKAIEKLYRENPHNYMVHYAMATCLLHDNKISEAIDYLKKSIEINPLFGQAYYNLGVIYSKQGNICDATRYFKKAIELEKHDTEIYQEACKALHLLENSVQELYGCSLDDYVRAGELYHMAFEHLNQRDFQGAIRLFERVLMVDPNHVQSYGNMGLAYAYLGKTDRALECFDKALTLDPEYMPALMNKKSISSLPKNARLPQDLHIINYSDILEKI